MLNDVVINSDLPQQYRPCSMKDLLNYVFCKCANCLLMNNACDVECINKVIESITVLNRFGFVFVVTDKDFQVWWKVYAQDLGS